MLPIDMFKIFDNLTAAENFTLFLYGKIINKMVRKHSGINQKTGKLKKGFRYSGKKIKNGAPEIIKVKARTHRGKHRLKGGGIKVGSILVPKDLEEHLFHWRKRYPKVSEKCLVKVIKEFENAGQDADKTQLVDKWFKCMNGEMPWNWDEL